MAVEPAAPAAPVAAERAAEAPAPGQPASSTEQAAPPADAFDMDAFIRDRAFGPPASSTLTPGGVVPTAELPAAASGEPAPESGDVSPDAVPAEADGTAGSQPPPGRRSSKARQDAATIESLQAEVETLRSSIPEQVAKAQREADEARADADRLRSEQASFEALADETIGSADEYARLLEIPDDEISNEDYQKRERWKANRKVYRPVQTRLAAEEQGRAQQWVAQTTRTWAEQATAVADALGLDRAELAKPENANVGSLMRLAASATEARVRAEQAERISQLERDLSAARGEALGGRRAPITNGAASGAAVGDGDINHWIRQRAGLA